MRLYEATNVNMHIIKTITDQVLNALPKKLDLSTPDSALTIRGKNLNLDQLENQYPKFKEFFDHIKETRFYFLNAPQYTNERTKGFYNVDNNIIVINISAIKGYYKQYDKEELLRNEENVWGIRAVLQHEIRHVMQHKDYPDHFNSVKQRTNDYRKRDIEIDAMWHNIIGTYNTKKFKPKAFVKRVMDDLEIERDLTPKLYKHYYNKTLKYYSDPTAYSKDNKKTDKRKVITNKIISIINSLGNQYDMRNIPNYNHDNFLFPVSQFKPQLIQSLKNKEIDNTFTKNMMYIVPSFGITRNLAALHRSYMKKVHNYDVIDAVKNIQDGIPENYFDFAALKKHLLKTYQVDADISEGKVSDMAKAGAVALSTLSPNSSDAADNTSYAPDTSLRPVARSVVEPTRPSARPDSIETITGNFNERFLLAGLKKLYTDKKEIAAFMAQVYHETHGFKSLAEYGDKDYFKNYDVKYNPQKAKILGNKKPGDGYKYRGRGFLHTTGAYNYKKLQDAIKKPVVKNPELLEKDIVVAGKAALYFWNNRVRNKVKDWDDVAAVTKAVNGGTNGLEEREKIYKHYLKRIDV